MAEDDCHIMDHGQDGAHAVAEGILNTAERPGDEQHHQQRGNCHRQRAARGHLLADAWTHAVKADNFHFADVLGERSQYNIALIVIEEFANG
jgi:hypothetical protein